jgi:hypothetical protein
MDKRNLNRSTTSVDLFRNYELININWNILAAENTSVNE